MYQERNIIAALSNFTNGRSLFQAIARRRWRNNHEGDNPNWMGFDYPPINIIITKRTTNKIYATISSTETLTKATIRSAIIHELQRIPVPSAVISVHFLGSDPFTKRYYTPQRTLT